MLTSAQLTTLKAAINAETDPAFVALRTAGSTGLMAEWYNVDSTFIVWKTRVSVEEVGDAIKSGAIVGLTSLKMQRLQLLTGDLSGGNINPSNADRRAGFDAIFDGVGDEATTRTQLAVLWKRAATRGEKVFATGTGTTGTPGNLVYEGSITDTDIVRALAS